MFQKSYEWVRSLEPTHGANGSSATVLSGGRYWLLGWRRSWLLFFLLFRQRAGPGRAQQREQIAVNAIVARDAPGQNQQNRQEAQDRVGADGPRQQIVEVHHQAKEGGNAGQAAYNQPNAHQDFSKGDEIGKERGIRHDERLQEAGIPVLYSRMRPGALGNRVQGKAFHRGAIVAAKDPGAAGRFAKAGDVD